MPTLQKFEQRRCSYGREPRGSRRPQVRLRLRTDDDEYVVGETASPALDGFVELRCRVAARCRLDAVEFVLATARRPGAPSWHDTPVQVRAKWQGGGAAARRVVWSSPASPSARGVRADAPLPLGLPLLRKRAVLEVECVRGGAANPNVLRDGRAVFSSRDAETSRRNFEANPPSGCSTEAWLATALARPTAADNPARSRGATRLDAERRRRGRGAAAIHQGNIHVAAAAPPRFHQRNIHVASGTRLRRIRPTAGLRRRRRGGGLARRFGLEAKSVSGRRRSSGGHVAAREIAVPRDVFAARGRARAVARETRRGAGAAGYSSAGLRTFGGRRLERGAFL